MKPTRMLFLLAAAALLSVLAPQSADAQLYGVRGLRTGVYGNAFGSSLYSLNRIPVPPYFALHPPVYYSGIRPTTYGSSPFANRPARIPYDVHVLPTPVVPAANGLRLRQRKTPKVVENPYTAPRDPERDVPEPPIKVIYNPYIDSGRAGKLASTKDS